MFNKKLGIINIIAFFAFIFVILFGIQKLNSTPTNGEEASNPKVNNEKESNKPVFHAHVQRPDFTYIPKHKNDFAIIFYEAEIEEEQKDYTANENGLREGETDKASVNDRTNQQTPPSSDSDNSPTLNRNNENQHTSKQKNNNEQQLEEDDLKDDGKLEKKNSNEKISDETTDELESEYITDQAGSKAQTHTVE